MHTAQVIPFRVESRKVRTPHSAFLRSRIVAISSRALGEMLDKYNETYTFLRATGAVEHRRGDGVLLARVHYSDHITESC
jgi:hypothetical protein